MGTKIMTVITKNFDEKKIDFEPFLSKKEVMVNATQMGKVFKKKVDNFLRTEQTKEFIIALENKYGSKINASKFNFQVSYMRLDQSANEQDNGGISTIEISENILKVVHGGRNNGTWMHRLLALDFAAWLDAEFKLWVLEIIEEILFGYAREQESSYERTIELRDLCKNLAEKENKSGDDFVTYLDYQKELKDQSKKRQKSTKQKIKQIYDLFSQPEGNE